MRQIPLQFDVFNAAGNAQAAREAEEYFHARGADAFVATYRAHAVKEPAAGERSPTRGADAEAAEVEPSSR